MTLRVQSEHLCARSLTLNMSSEHQASAQCANGSLAATCSHADRLAPTCSHADPPRTTAVSQTLNTGSLAWSACTALAYWYMVASWGGYSFIINLIPIHCLACIFTGRLSARLYVAYAPFIVMGTLEAGAGSRRRSPSLHTDSVRLTSSGVPICSFGPGQMFCLVSR